MGFLRKLFGKTPVPEEPNGQKPTNAMSAVASPAVDSKQDPSPAVTETGKNVEWWFHWYDSAPSEKEKKARLFFTAAKLALGKEFQHAAPSCLLLEYEDLAQRHYHVSVFFEQYPSREKWPKADDFVECVVKYGGPQPDDVNSYSRQASTAEEWLRHMRETSNNLPPGTGGAWIADTFVCRKEPAP